MRTAELVGPVIWKVLTETRSPVDTSSATYRQEGKVTGVIIVYGLYVVPCFGSLILGLHGGSVSGTWVSCLPEP